VPWGQLSL